jgi:hypothetical protein
MFTNVLAGALCIFVASFNGVIAKYFMYFVFTVGSLAFTRWHLYFCKCFINMQNVALI